MHGWVRARFDSDGGGYLDRDELARVFRTPLGWFICSAACCVGPGRLNSDFSMKDVDALCKDLDRGCVKVLCRSGSGGDGKVSHKEFLHWLKADSAMTQAQFNHVQRRS